MQKYVAVGCWLVFSLGGCAPSREAKSAGQVGCLPDEIGISDEESHFGLLQSGETWVATCRGRTFVCSQINQSGNDKSFWHTVSASEQVSCHERQQSREVEAKNRAQAVP